MSRVFGPFACRRDATVSWSVARALDGAARVGQFLSSDGGAWPVAGTGADADSARPFWNEPLHPRSRPFTPVAARRRAGGAQ